MMYKKYWFLDANKKSEEEVVYGLGYYTSNFFGEISRWFNDESYNGRTWIAYSTEEKEHRLNVVKFAIGDKTTEQLLHCREYRIEYVWELVGIVFERLTAYISSPNFSEAQSDAEKGLEDLCFYCGEVLRGIEGAFKLVNSGVVTDENVVEWLTDAIGCTLKDATEVEYEVLEEMMQEYVDGVRGIEDIVGQANKVRILREIKFGYQDEE